MTINQRPILIVLLRLMSHCDKYVVWVIFFRPDFWTFAQEQMLLNIKKFDQRPKAIIKSKRLNAEHDDRERQEVDAL